VAIQPNPANPDSPILLTSRFPSTIKLKGMIWGVVDPEAQYLSKNGNSVRQHLHNLLWIGHS
jgi:hypothetical protein